MSLRSLLSNLTYSRSRQERPEEAGLILSRRLKDLLADTERQLSDAANTAEACPGDSKGPAETETSDPKTPAVKTAA